MTEPDLVRVGRVEHAVTVLGPGVRSVVWVAGCRLACPGCTTPELWDPRAGRALHVDALAGALARHALDGLTWSGGEPFEQAAALAAVTALLRSARPDLSVMAYSGFTLGALKRRRDPGVAALLAQLDLLVDGRYIRDRHAALRWRGSSNQTIHALSARHRASLLEPDVHAGVHSHVDPSVGFRFTGVPPVPDFRVRLETVLRSPDKPDPQENPAT